MIIVVERNRAEDIVVLVHRIAEIASFLLVKVFTIGVAVLWFLGAGVDEAAVLRWSAIRIHVQGVAWADHVRVYDIEELGLGESCPALGELRVCEWSRGGGEECAGERAGGCNAPGEHARGV
jgi:hypothetical protein